MLEKIMDKRTQRAKINALSTLLNQLLSTAIGVVIPWIMIRSFGSEAYGATTSIAQFLAYISLFEGGIGRVARGALYAPLAAGDEDEVSRIYLAVKRFFSIIGFAFLGYTLILAFCYYDISDISGFTREYVFALVIAIAIGKFAEYMGGITNITLFNADRRQYVVNSVVIVTGILNVILIAILASSGVDILWVKLTSSLVFVLKPIIFTVYLKTHYRIKKTKSRAVLQNKATGIAQHIAYVVQNNSDVLILTVCADLNYVAVYSVYHLISFSLRNITTSFTGGMEAHFGNLIAKGERENLIEYYKRYKFILTVLTVMLFGAAGALIVPFVKLYTHDTTDTNYVQPIFAIILLLSDAINCLVWPCFNLSIAANKLKESQTGAFVETAINLIVSFALVLWNPLVGVAVGTLVSAIFKSVYYIVFASKQILHRNEKRMLSEFFVTVAVLLCVSIGGMIIASYMPLYNYWRWIVGGFMTVAITAPISIILAATFYPKTFKSIMTLIKRSVIKSK